MQVCCYCEEDGWSVTVYYYEKLNTLAWVNSSVLEDEALCEAMTVLQPSLFLPKFMMVKLLVSETESEAGHIYSSQHIHIYYIIIYFSHLKTGGLLSSTYYYCLWYWASTMDDHHEEFMLTWVWWTSSAFSEYLLEEARKWLPSTALVQNKLLFWVSFLFWKYYRSTCIYLIYLFEYVEKVIYLYYT